MDDIHDEWAGSGFALSIGAVSAMVHSGHVAWTPDLLHHDRTIQNPTRKDFRSIPG
jgi:hypothetical protein